MSHTHRHFRSFWRNLSLDSVLFTEMVCADELVTCSDEEDMDRHLGYMQEIEEPVVLQLGGRNPNTLRQAVQIATAERFNYRSINLNAGCPSNVVAGLHTMGAALMLEPELTAECCSAMREGANSNANDKQIDISVKCRIGVDDHDDYAFLHRFVDIVSTQGGVKRFQIHARKALISGQFTTMDNRDVPPLQYDRVYQLVNDFPHLQFEVNGGFSSPEDVADQLAVPVGPGVALEGVMVGRAVVNHPYMWVHVDRMMREEARVRGSGIESGMGSGMGSAASESRVTGVGSDAVPSRGEILDKYISYCERYEDLRRGANRPPAHRQKQEVSAMLSPTFNLFTGEAACDPFKRSVLRSVSGGVTAASVVLRAAARAVPPEALYGRVGLYEPMDKTMQKFEKMQKTTGRLKSRIL